MVHPTQLFRSGKQLLQLVVAAAVLGNDPCKCCRFSGGSGGGARNNSTSGAAGGSGTPGQGNWAVQEANIILVGLEEVAAPAVLEVMHLHHQVLLVQMAVQG
jgi:hypothetical protein